MIMLFISLIAVLAIVVVYRYEGIAKPQKAVDAAIPSPVAPVPEMATGMPFHEVFMDRGEYVPDPLVVRHLNGDKATLMLRYRSNKQKCTAHLIIWSGKKRRRFNDSYYDLGVKDAQGIGDELIEEFVNLAMTKISDLQSAGSKKRNSKKEVATEDSKSETVLVPAGSNGGETVSLEENVKPDPAIKVRKFPSVYRGKILEIGFMPRVIDNEEKESFGVRYRASEGVEDVVWGVNLRTALREAGAKVGDEVEILKIGRKTVEEGKAPMNLFTVAKIVGSLPTS